jgi:hypothetical protein
MTALHLASESAKHFGELTRDPLLTVACVLLMVVSVGWVIVSRLISRNFMKAAMRARTARQTTELPSRDIWSYPP